MERLLDVRTLIFLCGPVTAVLCIIMVSEFLWHKVYAGFEHWTIATVLVGLGGTLMSLRGHLPDFISIVAANILIVAYYQFISYGLAKFFSLTVSRRADIAVSLFLIGLLSYYTYLSPQITARILINACVHIFYCLRIARLLLKGLKSNTLNFNRILCWTFFSLAAWLSFYCAKTFLQWQPLSDLMLAGPLFGTTILFYLLSFILITAGLIQVNNSRIERDLLEAQKEIKTLSGFLPICASCKRVRDDKGYWDRVENYISKRTHVEFTHGICPECMKKLYPQFDVPRKD